MLKLLHLLLFITISSSYSYDIKITNTSTWRIILNIQTTSCKVGYILEPNKSTILNTSKIININIETYGDIWKWLNLSYKSIWPIFNNDIKIDSDIMIDISINKLNWNVQYKNIHKLKNSIELYELSKYINKYIAIFNLLYNLENKSKGDLSIKLHNIDLNQLRYLLGAPKHINNGNLHSNFSEIFCNLLTLIGQRLYFINNILDPNIQNEKIVKFYKELSKYAVINILFKLQLEDKTILVDNDRLDKLINFIVINHVIKNPSNISSVKLKDTAINNYKDSIKAINQLRYIVIDNIYNIANNN